MMQHECCHSIAKLLLFSISHYDVMMRSTRIRLIRLLNASTTNHDISNEHEKFLAMLFSANFLTAFVIHRVASRTALFFFSTTTTHNIINIININHVLLVE